ncbi:hypothetical protein QBC43DRAFT_219765 [Cladorrhinum sp. PSN259]|nr:hypothetical protein QBC43DRAFT_219765 [Cladorrhinum sp. PSN259]
MTRAARRAHVNKFACAKCQKRKTKCDGCRPQCGACAKRNDAKCEYPVREGAMSRYSDLKETFAQMQRENQDLRELISYIKKRPEEEAFEVYKRLRTADDPLQVLQFFRHADTLLLMPSSNGALICDRKAQELEHEAQSLSDIKVPSRPWTVVAGDGLVSCLISSFFKWDNSLLMSFVDRDLFLRDMRGGSGQYCSSFLVNSICALRSLMSDRPKIFNRAANIDLCALFSSEAKKQLELEAGRVSVTTIQGLLILYILSCCDGTNRAGSVYRMAAYEMLRKLKPERLYSRLRDNVPAEAERKHSLSKLCWGVYLLECVLSHAYLKPSTFSVPKVSWVNHDNGHNTPNVDIRGLPFGLGSPEPPLVPGTTHQAYHIAILYHDIMNYNSQLHIEFGDFRDIEKRMGLFAQLAKLEEALPDRLRYRNNPAPDTLFLKSLINLAAYNLIRPLPLSAIVQEGVNAKAILLDLCATDVDILEFYASRWNFKDYSSIILCSAWSVTLTLVTLLDDPRAQELFTRGCVILGVIERDMTGVRIVMQGMLAMLWKTGKQIPPGASQYFAGLDTNRRELKDVPFEFSLPVPEVTQKLLDYEDDDDPEETTRLGADLASLLQKWSSLSVV